MNCWNLKCCVVIAVLNACRHTLFRHKPLTLSIKCATYGNWSATRGDELKFVWTLWDETEFDSSELSFVLQKNLPIKPLFFQISKLFRENKWFNWLRVFYLFGLSTQESISYVGMVKKILIKIKNDFFFDFWVIPVFII